MTPREILDKIRSLGGSVIVAAGALMIKAPDPLRDEARRRSHELVTLLSTPLRTWRCRTCENRVRCSVKPGPCPYCKAVFWAGPLASSPGDRDMRTVPVPRPPKRFEATRRCGRCGRLDDGTRVRCPKCRTRDWGPVRVLPPPKPRRIPWQERLERRRKERAASQQEGR
jgi:hypothetical protein